MGVGGMVFGVVKSWGWSPHEWNNCPCKKRRASLFSLLCTLRTAWEDGCLQTRIRVLTRHQIWFASTLILNFVVSRTMSNKGLLFKATQCKVTCYSSVDWKKKKCIMWELQIKYLGQCEDCSPENSPADSSEKLLQRDLVGGVCVG